MFSLVKCVISKIHTGFRRHCHNFHYTPGLLLSKVDDPKTYIQGRKGDFDDIFVKQYVTGADLYEIKKDSG